MMRSLLLVICMLWALPVMAEVPVRSITVYGKAEQQVAPDVALLQVTVQNEGQELKAVKREQDKDTAQLMEITADNKIKDADVKTQYSRLNPKYRYTNGKQIFEGYEATTGVQIKIRDLTTIAPLMQKLVETGFERIGNVSYALDDEVPHHDELLLAALDNAKDKATKMAARLGQKAGKPISIAEDMQRVSPQPVMMMRSEMAMASAAPGAAPPAGMIDLNAFVTVTFALMD